MSISSSLAHKYDEFDEFPQQSAPKSAYEELKECCEKHNIPCEFWASEYSSDLCARFCDDLLVFDKNGKFLTID